MSKTILYQTIQSSIKTQLSSIWPKDRTLSSDTIPGQCGPGSDGNKGIFRIHQSFRITTTSTSDCFVSYPANSLWKSYPFTGTQFGNSPVPADWTSKSFIFDRITWYHITVLKHCLETNTQKIRIKRRM